MRPTDVAPAAALPDNNPPQLEKAIAELLQRVTECWGEFSTDALSERESQALSLLVAAELIERRCRVRLQMHRHPLVIEAQFTATGEYGLIEAVNLLAAAIWNEWRTAYVAWRESDAQESLAFHSEQLEPSEWRLTESGEQAKQDLAEGREKIVWNFVLRRWPLIYRPPVRGHGRLVKLDKVKADACPASLAIGNWKEGAAAFSAAFCTLFEKWQSQDTPTPFTPPAAPVNAAKGSRMVGRKAITEQRLQRYLRDREASYRQLVEAVLQDQPDAVRQFTAEFGATAFAVHVAAETIGDCQEVDRIKTAVQKTKTYQDYIKVVLRRHLPKMWLFAKSSGSGKQALRNINGHS